MWPKFLPLATLAYNTFNSPNLGNYSQYELLHSFEQEIKISTEILHQFRSKWLAMINKNHENFQYNSGDLVYIISPLTSQL